MMQSHLPTIKIGSRASKLALVQAQEVKNLLLKFTDLKETQIKIIPLTTSGDKIQDRSLADIGGKGLFIKELEEALISKKIDIAVHSAKDVPPCVHESAIIAAFTKRKEANDYFISEKFSSINDLPKSARVGTSSARRKACLLRLRPDLEIVNFRGNVDTRLKKLSNNEVDATILALCGLNRLEKKIIDKNIIPTEIMLPAAGQGCLAIQIRQDDEVNQKLVAKINHDETQLCVQIERDFLRQLGASCKTPVAAYCKIENEKVIFKTIIFDFCGQEIFSTKQESSLAEAITLSDIAAQKTLTNGADLLKKII